MVLTVQQSRSALALVTLCENSRGCRGRRGQCSGLGGAGRVCPWPKGKSKQVSLLVGHESGSVMGGLVELDSCMQLTLSDISNPRSVKLAFKARSAISCSLSNVVFALPRQSDMQVR